MIIRWCERARFVSSVFGLDGWACWLSFYYTYIFHSFYFRISDLGVWYLMVLLRKWSPSICFFVAVVVCVCLSMMSHRHCRSVRWRQRRRQSWWWLAIIIIFFCILSDSSFKIHGKSSSVKEIHSTHSFFNRRKKIGRERERERTIKYAQIKAKPNRPKP